MQYQDQRYYELAEKWLDGTISEEEKKEFSEWYHSQQDELVSIPYTFAKSDEELKERIFQSIQEKQKRGASVILLRKSRWMQLAAASLFILLCGTVFYATQKTSHPADSKQALNTSKKKEELVELKPGGNKAILTLGNGSQIVLDSASQGLIAREQSGHVVKTADGQLIYQQVANDNAPVAYNTLSTPKGGQYAIVLADGTKVWLNAASTLRFPTAFKGKERRVELQGEGYFEVAKNANMPFKVEAGKMEVRVLGTHFNVMSYDDESEAKTTLLEGSVRVQQDESIATIQPGEQARLNKAGTIKVEKKVNTDQVVAWKEGRFQFEETDIENVMRQISRWYNVTIHYDQKVAGHFSGTIEKNVTIDKVLHMLELTGAVHFGLNGRTVFVHH